MKNPNHYESTRQRENVAYVKHQGKIAKVKAVYMDIDRLITFSEQLENQAANLAQTLLSIRYGMQNDNIERLLNDTTT